MAIFYPDLLTITKSKVKPTNGEQYLLNYLNENLDDTYEIYFQPYINGDRPDIVVMRKGSGVLIIEVKDWNLKNFRNINGEWFVRKDNEENRILSPYKQVSKYKDNLYDLHIPNLLKKKILDSRVYSVINCGIYFHNANKLELDNFIKNEGSNNKKYTVSFTKDQISDNKFFTDWIKKTHMNSQSSLFKDDIYNCFRNILQPSFHSKEDGIEIIYSKEQKLLIESKNGDKKIKGVAGSGKTIVLAKRAVNSHIRTGEKVLILCYNITLRNYLHDAISKVREAFDWKFFNINNYHNFISSTLNNLEITPKNLFIRLCENDSKLNKYTKNQENFEKILSDMNEELGIDYVSDIWEKAIYSNYDFFTKFEIDESYKYDSIFIDEVQDYQFQWLEIIKKCFLKPNGEFVIFGDEKQNIYDRELDSEKKVRTNIAGRWDESLKKSYRLHKNIVSIATNFQNEYLKNYGFDNIEIVDQLSLFNNQNLKIDYFDVDNDSKIISKLIKDYKKFNGLHSNDIAVLGQSTSLLREIDFKLRKITGEKTSTTFETREIFEKVFNDKFNKISESNFNIKLSKKYLEGNLQIALKKVMTLIDNEGNINNQIDKIDSNSIKIDEQINYLINLMTPIMRLEIDKVRKCKKFKFWMNSGLVKLSTIHSFKGWEIPSLFIILDNSLDKHSKHELIYTALTRCRFNLIIINTGCNIYRDFFSKSININ